MSSSKSTKPRSTSCMAATQVTSLVADARQIVVSNDAGGDPSSGLTWPNGLK
jgi:hypothetical protein